MWKRLPTGTERKVAFARHVRHRRVRYGHAQCPGTCTCASLAAQPHQRASVDRGIETFVAAGVDLLNAGVDSYVLKPNHRDELLARMRSLTRRTEPRPDSVMQVFDLEIDLSSRKVKRGGRIISLTPRKYALLAYLAAHQGRVVSRSMILENVYEGREESNVINVYIRYLHNKMIAASAFPSHPTRYGQGYLLRGSMEKDHGSSPITISANG